jgi:ectoine hydrolase
MAESNLNFTRAEYAARLTKTRAAMQAKGIDLLLVSDPSNMAWLTGYDGWSFYVHQCVLVPPDGEPFWYGRGQDANGAKRTAYIADDHILAYPDHYVQSTERHPMDLLSHLIEERGWQRGRIGVEMDNYWFSAAAYGSSTRSSPACASATWWRKSTTPGFAVWMGSAATIRRWCRCCRQERMRPPRT